MAIIKQKKIPTPDISCGGFELVTPLNIGPDSKLHSKPVANVDFDPYPWLAKILSMLAF